MIRIEHPYYPQGSEWSDPLNRAWDEITKSDAIGFCQLAQRDDLWDACEAAVNNVPKECEDVVVIGVGGSHLGTEVINRAFPIQKRRLHMLDNLDPIYFEKKWNDISDLKSAHWVIASKSGTTLETLSLANFAVQKLESQGIQLSENCTVVTEKKSNSLHDWAEKNGAQILEIPENVGGRFSVLSPVGMFPAALAGLDLKKFRDGIRWAMDHPDISKSLAEQYLSSLKDEKYISMFWAYSDQLCKFGDWWQQLWAESLAKKETIDGQPAPKVSTPMACRGANDQHSLLQQVMEGERDKFLCFLTIKSNEAEGLALANDVFGSQGYCEGRRMGEILKIEAQANFDSLRESGVPIFSLELDQLNEASMGALFMLFQLKVALIGHIFKINTFDQPGVEQGKVLTKRILTEGNRS